MSVNRHQHNVFTVSTFPLLFACPSGSAPAPNRRFHYLLTLCRTISRILRFRNEKFPPGGTFDRDRSSFGDFLHCVVENSQHIEAEAIDGVVKL